MLTKNNENRLDELERRMAVIEKRLGASSDREFEDNQEGWLDFMETALPPGKAVRETELNKQLNDYFRVMDYDDDLTEISLIDIGRRANRSGWKKAYKKRGFWRGEINGYVHWLRK